MKQLLLVMLIVMLVTVPCFAQEVEPDGLFSIEGTTWRCIGLMIEADFSLPIIELYDETMKFPDSIGWFEPGYLNLGVFIVLGGWWNDSCKIGLRRSRGYEVYVILPWAGVGTFLIYHHPCKLPPSVATGIMVKQIF